jgi:hypothetical protein
MDAGHQVVFQLFGTREINGRRVREWRAQSPGARFDSSASIASLEGRGARKTQWRNRSGSAIAVSVPEHLFVSPAFRLLAPLERYLLIELLAVAKRVGTDEPINCSVRTAADMCGVSGRHGARAISTLEAKGFLVRIRRGERRQGRGFASRWRITCLPFQGEWATCEYNRVHDREHNRKIVEDRKGETKLFTPELEALWVKTEASFARRSHSGEDAEIEELLPTMDAEAQRESLKRNV